MKLLPSQEILRSIFSYDAETGELRFLRRADRSPQWNSRWGGRLAGNRHDDEGRSKVMVNGSLFFCHRVIWKWMTGEDALGLVDHWDTDPPNNRWTNLRLASDSQNAMNRNRRRGKGLPKGVYWHKAAGKFVAQIGVDNVTRHLGVFATADAAHAAYRAAAADLHRQFARIA